MSILMPKIRSIVKQKIERSIGSLVSQILKREINEMMELVNEHKEPNLSELWIKLRELNAISYSVKQEGYRIGGAVYEHLITTPIPGKTHNSLVLDWKLSTQADIESGWFRY